MRLKQEEQKESARQKTIAKELEWVRRGAKARTTKQKGRLQRYETVADLVKMLEYTGDVVFEGKNDRILVRKR